MDGQHFTNSLTYKYCVAVNISLYKTNTLNTGATGILFISVSHDRKTLPNLYFPNLSKYRYNVELMV